MRAKSFAEFVGSFLSIPFKAGGTEADGYDCLGLVCRVCQTRGLDFPERFDKWNKENYYELYRINPKKAYKLMITFFDSFAKRIDVNRIVAGDLIIVKQIDELLFPAVYVGAGNAITSFIKTGVNIFHLDKVNQIKFAWSLKKWEHHGQHYLHGQQSL